MTHDTELGSHTPDRRRNKDASPDDCTGECSAIFILERRVDSHTNELKALKEMIATNNVQTKEILDIVGLGRAFFKVLGWIGSMIKPIVIVGSAVAATVAWIKTGTLK